ncbi:potassium transporter Kup [Actinotignum sp. GS-2025f]|uniref:potassium transporter Kup n=1 Tax=Actinotignum sp. GS-2025f TaxID=3427279 RepID=UPI003F44CA7B
MTRIFRAASLRRDGGEHSAHRGGTLARAGLGLAALGVVFGDIGTSPLYVVRAVFTVHGGAVPLTDASIYGVISLVVWMLLLIVSFKYVILVLRADNDGEGGIIALATLLRTLSGGRPRAAALFTVAGMFGAALFFGDAVITPAISVLSAIEGIRVALPTFPSTLIVPIALVILLTLGWMQRYGTGRVGAIFGPFMLLWFTGLALIALPHIAAHPEIIAALSPHQALIFVGGHPAIGFLAMGAVVLAVTGAEALYADIAHFGRRPISAVWFAVVLPALVCNYLGQGALLLEHPEAIADPFFHLVSSQWALVLMLLATGATVIASQSVIAGTYSIARQASRLGYLPHLRIRYTSASGAGQIYLPDITGLLVAAVAAVVVIFRDSARLSSAYGLAVSTDFLLTTAMLLALTVIGWHWRWWQSAALAVVLGVVEVPLFAANAAKLVTGGWLPLLIALILMVVMLTWRRGEAVVAATRARTEGTLAEFAAHLQKNPLRRVPGTVIYPHSLATTVPAALRATTELHRSMRDHVIILSIKTAPQAHIERAERITRTQVSPRVEGVVHLTMRYGFMDIRNIPADLEWAQREYGWGSWKLSEAQWVLSHLGVRARGKNDDAASGGADSGKSAGSGNGAGSGSAGDIPQLPRWQAWLFARIARHSASPAWVKSLPADRTVEISREVIV